MRLLRNAALSMLLLSTLAAAQQDGAQQASPCMAGMRMPGCPDSTGQASDEQSNAGQGMQMGKTGLMSMQGMQAQTFLQAIAHHATSGTSAEPNSTPTPMLMTNKGPWMLMFHANVFLTDIQQSSPRGGDKFFSTNWLMPMAQRELGRGIFTVRAM